MVVIGIIMFLFPPIPGVPIYFTAGIILVAAGESTLGVPMAMAYTCGVCMVLKLMACAMQQVGIGASMRKNVAVRQAVGVNSELMRTVKLCLQKPGYSAVKVAILVGGPDWPTSVLCGVLELPLLPMLIGTLPVIVIIVPTVLSGSFVYLAENYTWAGTASAISMSVTGLVIMAMPAIMMYHVEKAMEEEKEALAAMPLDKEVLKADANQEQQRLLYLEVTKWKSMPKWMKANLVVGNLLMFVACNLALGAGGACFKTFSMSDSIEKDLGGDTWSLIKPLGWVSIFCFLGASFCLFVFSKWASRKTKDVAENLFIVGARQSSMAHIAQMSTGDSVDKGGGDDTV